MSADFSFTDGDRIDWIDRDDVRICERRPARCLDQVQGLSSKY